MSNVNLTIGGRNFAVSAGDGEEDHIAMLGRMVDERVRSSGVASQTETRMLLFVALMLADELHEAHLREPPPAPEPPPPPELPPPPPIPGVLVARVEALAARVEKLATSLEESRSEA